MIPRWLSPSPTRYRLSVSSQCSGAKMSCGEVTCGLVSSCLGGDRLAVGAGYLDLLGNDLPEPRLEHLQVRRLVGELDGDGIPTFEAQRWGDWRRDL
jgi:hypothetical protein